MSAAVALMARRREALVDHVMASPNAATKECCEKILAAYIDTLEPYRLTADVEHVAKFMRLVAASCEAALEAGRK